MQILPKCMLLLAIGLLLPLPMQAQATTPKYAAPFDPLPPGEAERLDAPYLEAVKALSTEQKVKIKDLELALLKTLIGPSEAMDLSERLRVCRGKIPLPPDYDFKVEKISSHNKKQLAAETKKFLDDTLPQADYIDPKILRDHLLADQGVQLEVNQNVIIASLGDDRFDAPSCYRLRDRIDQYLIDNDIKLGN